MGAMNTTLIWILLAVIVLALLIAGIVVLVGNNRKKSKTVSFEKPAEAKQLTQQEKSGNYQAKGGFSFAPAEAEPVEAGPAAGAAAGIAGAAAGGSTALSALGDQLEQPHALAQPDDDQPDIELSREGQEAAAQTGGEDDGATAPAGLAPEGEPAEPVDVVEPANADEREEAEEAANIAAVTAEVAGQAREEGAVASPEAVVDTPAPGEEIDEIAPAAGRIGKLRGRLTRSQNAIGQGLLGILTAGDLDEDAWEEIEDTLIMADLGTQLTMKVTESLRVKIAERGVSSEAEARAMLRETLIEAAHPEMDRSIKAMPNEGKPAVILVVGVNGTGKTTTTGKLARVLVSLGHTVVLGAADTFRAAAADQLETWGRRVGAATVRGKEGADPASVAFDAVATGVDRGADVVVVDTAGRLHTKTGLMDQLGKVKRVVEKKSRVDEVLLVLDATVGQNGITQARVFRDVVDITGVVLTKLDGTAKGGIVFQVQGELGVPVKLVGLGEGADDLAPFEVESFVDALLG
ncbi:signal recognition particle-docking protein FtsY [Corynebacterium liangguodongii]|uniref:Signal recognition particle receptor FtsY n=1 Tax=Corynebacterium liangguodongii TaxID=2079535 RepID=A0A2S0WEQ3_9CORY|nr:signal recognition particle-docking protein FtsY [Corynebacterium liangguodongii]AWB84263.1 signal recognition particle-docking protein FtsY [Corynebacterium liangguodongii]PWC00272.1 signal recognition particle-docking protein FtsY [Corynebacterium liangguodongii]